MIYFGIENEHRAEADHTYNLNALRKEIVRMCEGHVGHRMILKRDQNGNTDSAYNVDKGSRLANTIEEIRFG